MAERRRVAFPSGALRLEGLLHLPDRPGPFPAAVVCHPHPLYGGSMHNNVVAALCAALPDQGWAALCFNFRGVGASQGAYGGGVPEQEDVRAALRFLAGLPEVAGDRLAVAGYSFGSWVGLSAAAADPRVTALVAVSPPLPTYDFGFLVACPEPKLFLYGDRDQYVGQAALQELLAALPEPKEHRLFPGADHFWLAREGVMAAAAGAFLAGTR